MPAPLSPLAARLIDAWRSNQPVGTLPEGEAPADMAAGYAVQDAFFSAIGEPLGGFKLAMASKSGMAKAGIARPARGAMPKSRIVQNGARIPKAPIPYVVEVEIGLVIGRTVRPGDAVGDLGSLVKEARIVFELVGGRFAERASQKPWTLLADLFSFHYLVVGDVIGAKLGDPVFDEDGFLELDGRKVIGGFAGDDRASATESLKFLLADCADAGITLEPGMIISTGSISIPYEMAGTGEIVSRVGTAEVRATIV